MTPARPPSWDERYDSNDYLFGTEPNEFLVSVASQLPAGGRTLCLGDGEGRNGVYLAGLGFDVTSMDSSGIALEKAQNLARQRHVNLTLEQADISDYNMGEGEWDAIVSIFFHLPRQLRISVHRAVINALKPGGYFVLEAYQPAQLTFGTGGPPDVDRLVNAANLTEELGELNWLQMQEIERDVVEGYGHTGRAAVIQLLATA